MNRDEIITWLLAGDVSVRYQVWRDLSGIEKPRLRQSIRNEGWGAKLLTRRNKNGHWGRSFYFPKWICTHYTLLDLKNLGIPVDTSPIQQTLKLLQEERGPDGGIFPDSKKRSDVCVNGMFLNYACYFQTPSQQIDPVVDFLLTQRMPDGGFNCMSNHGGANHSSLHTTLSVLEGILEYQRNGYTYRLKELLQSKATGEEFMLMHRLFRSDKTGEVIKPSFLNLYYPCRWYYDILRALDYLQMANCKYDKRMNDAIDVINKKMTKQGTWKLAAKHPGQTHFEMEKAGQPSRWNTLRVLRVLKHFNLE